MIFKRNILPGNTSAFIKHFHEKSGFSRAFSSSNSRETGGKMDLENTLDKETGIRTIRLNRPKKLNAINRNIYAGIPTALYQSSEDPETKLTVITGSGRYFSSGNDLVDFARAWSEAESPKAAAEASAQILRNFVAAFIEYPKILVAVVNGPAVGLSATILGLFDVVFMSDDATLRTPFATTAQSPEGCSSYTFPRILGSARANQMLLFDKILSAGEAESCGLASQVFPAAAFEAEVGRKLEEMASMSPAVLENMKRLIRGHERDILHKVNEKECRQLVDVWQSEECAAALRSVAAKIGGNKS